MEVGDWLQNNMSILLSTPATWLGLIIGAILIPSSRVRRTVYTTIAVTMIVQSGLIVWLARRQIARAEGPKPAPTSSPQAKPRPSPSVPNQASTPQPSPLIEQGEIEASEAVQFSVSSRNDPLIRMDYCLDGEFEGETSTNSNSINVTIGRANFDLCRYSVANTREVQFQVGVGKNSDIKNIKNKASKNAIAWSKPVVVGEIAAGEFLNVAPQQLSFKKSQLVKKKGRVNLSEYGLVFRVYNPDRHGEYFLSRENAFTP